MPSPSVSASIRLTPAEKRRIAAEARKHGLSPAAYIKRAALAALERPARSATGSGASDDDRLQRLSALVDKLHEAVEDEMDYRLAAAAWGRHVKGGSKLLTGEEVWRELGL